MDEQFGKILQFYEYNYLAGIMSIVQNEMNHRSLALKQDPHNLDTQNRLRKLNHDMEALQRVVLPMSEDILTSLENKYDFRLKALERAKPEMKVKP